MPTATPARSARFRATRRSCCRSSASRSTRCAICSWSRPTRACPAASPVCSSSSARTTGNVEPQRVIAGPKTGITRLRQIGLDPATGRIFVAAINNEYLPPYNIDKPREGLPSDVELPSPWNTGSEGFIGVWNDEGDDGDVPPHSVIKGRSTGIVHPAGVTFNAADGEVIAPDAVWNGLFTFLKPELFKMPPAAAR